MIEGLRMHGLKRCSRCTEDLPFAAFGKGSTRDGLRSVCKACRSRDHLDNREQNCQRMRDYHKQQKPLREQEVFEHLGHTCACCGEDNKAFLTIDHINRDGKLEKDGCRSGRSLWMKMRREGWPKDKYRILCFICNIGRERDGSGICPHVNEPVPLGACA